MFPTIVRRATTKLGLDIPTNPYKAKRVWPPDFEKLPPKYQFRLERRYRRRTKLKWARPRWTKAIKLAQLGSITFILTYGILFMDWGTEKTPFKGIRDWVKEQRESIWTRRPDEKPSDYSPTASSSATSPSSMRPPR